MIMHVHQPLSQTDWCNAIAAIEDVQAKEQQRRKVAVLDQEGVISYNSLNKQSSTKESIYISEHGIPCWIQEELVVRSYKTETTRVLLEDVQKEHHHESLSAEGNHRYGKLGEAQNNAWIITLVASLKSCTNQKDLDAGTKLHASIIKWGLLEKDVVAGNALVTMYAQCNGLERAREIFDGLPIRDTISWNSLMAAYLHSGHAKGALCCFERMQDDGLLPDPVTFSCVLKACGSLGDIGMGQEVHALLVRERLLEENVVLATVLVDMYVKCAELDKAQEALDHTRSRDVVLWNTLIMGYVQHGLHKEALQYFQRMQLEGLPPSAVTFLCTLKACGSIRNPLKGQEIHAQIVREGLLDGHVRVGTSLVDMLAKCGLLEKAQQVLEGLPDRDAASWTALITGYAQHECAEEALICFEKMELEGCSPDALTFAAIFKACGIAGIAFKGQTLHAEITKSGILEKDTVIGTAVVDMYANCGMLLEARDVFDTMADRDVVLWDTLMAGYSQLGQPEYVSHLFNSMIGEFEKPNLVTFTILIQACSHSGLVAEGQASFANMSTNHGIVPTIEHYACMVDLFGRAGHLGMVVSLIEELPFSPSPGMWHSFLGSCQKGNDVNLRKWAFEYAMQSDEMLATAYVSASNIVRV